MPPADLRALRREDLHRARSSATTRIVPLRALEPGVFVLGLVERPDAGVQGHGDAVPRPRRSSTSWRGAAARSTSSARPRATPAAPPSTRCAASAASRSFMLSPHGRMSPFQQAQMFSLQDANIHNIAIDGVFDDCQDLVKAVSADLAFKQRARDRHRQLDQLGAPRWRRSSTTSPATSRRRDATASAVDFAVPTGNFGNICAGHVARRWACRSAASCSRPTRTTCSTSSSAPAATACAAAAETHETSSPSMDISKASNFERFVFDARRPRRGAHARALRRGRDAARVHADRRPSASAPAGASASSAAAARAPTGWRRSAHVHRRFGEVIDPHTADAPQGRARARRSRRTPMVVLETALAGQVRRDRPRGDRHRRAAAGALRRPRGAAAPVRDDAGRRRCAEGLDRRK